MSRLTWVAGVLAWPFVVAAPLTFPAASLAVAPAASPTALPRPSSTGPSTDLSTGSSTGSSTASATASATPSPSPTPSPTASPSVQDVAFLRAAHQDNLAEIAAGTAAEHRGSSARARSLGTQMVRDHTRLDADLQRIATRLSLDMPTVPTAIRQHQLDQISAHIGKAFDRAWVAAVTAWNTDALADDQGESRSGTLNDVKALARDAIDLARNHLSKLGQVPLDGSRMPTPTKTNTDDYAASQSPTVISVAAGMIILGGGMLVLTARAAVSRRRR